MLWKVVKRSGKHCVVKEDSGKQVACHDSRQEALDHLRALFRSAENTAVNELLADEPTETFQQEGEGRRVRLYFREGERTADRRVINPNAINFNRPPPWPLRIQRTQPETGGHAGAELCGVIESAMRDGHIIITDARIDLGSEAGQEMERLAREGILQTWSPDLGDVVMDTEILAEDEDGSPQDWLEHVVEAEFLGATITALPALDSAVLELLDDEGNILISAPSRQGNDATYSAPEHVSEVIDAVAPSAVAACAGPTAPPASFFSDPKLPELQRYITVTSDGRVYGHLASWGECHISYPRVCVSPPREDDYSFFHIGQVKTSDGTLVATGPISLRGGHADLNLTSQDAQSHYDNVDNAIIDVSVGPDPHGIWFSGSLRPDVTDAQLRRLIASGVSGDWREIDGQLRLIGICSVNVPGFPKIRLISSGQEAPRPVALVAVGGRARSSEDCDCAPDDIQFDTLLARVSDDPFDTLAAKIITDLDFDTLQSRIA